MTDDTDRMNKRAGSVVGQSATASALPPGVRVSTTLTAATLRLSSLRGTLAAYPWEHIDLAEISPAILEASRLYFRRQSRDALDDPRVTTHVNDGRNVLLVASAPYELITMELTSVWFAGAASLYSREFYELARARLAPGGVLQQWVQLHHIRRSELATILRTLRAVFPEVALFVGGGQGILVASATPLVASEARLARLEAHPPLGELLGGERLATLLDDMTLTPRELERYVAESAGAALSTDDNLMLEYATPKGNVMNYDASLAATLAELQGYRGPGSRRAFLGP